MTSSSRSLLLSFVVLFVLVASTSTSSAHPRKNGPFGLGVILHEPTGLTGKYWFDANEALDFHLGLDGIGGDHDDELGIYVDYLFHIDVGANTPYFSMPLYIGPGGGIIFDDDDRYCTKHECYYHEDDDIYLMARMPFGLAFLFTKFGGEAFVELSLQLFLIPDTHTDLDAALGFRYYF